MNQSQAYTTFVSRPLRCNMLAGSLELGAMLLSKILQMRREMGGGFFGDLRYEALRF